MNSTSIPSTKRIGEDMLMLFHFDRRKKSEKEKKPPRFLVLRRKWLTLGAAVVKNGEICFTGDFLEAGQYGRVLREESSPMVYVFR